MTLHGDCAGKGTGLSAARWDAAPVGFPGHLAEPCLPAERILGRAGGSSVSLMTTLGLVSTLPQSCGCICRPEGAELEGAVLQSLPAVHLHGGPWAGGISRLPSALPCPPPTTAYSPGCPSHLRSSLPSAAAAVPGNLSLKSINFSHTPRERCKSPSLLPPWLLSATIWHRPPRPPTPALPLIPARQPELYDLSRESPRTKPWAALRPRWFF